MPYYKLKLTSSQNSRALRKLLDGVNSHIHSLQSLGVEQGSYSSLLCPVLVGKLPPDMQLLISRKVSDDDWKLDSLMKAIEEVSARERINIDQSRPPPRKKDPPPSATSLVSSGTSSVSSPCCYCNKFHLPMNCDVILQVEARKQALRCSGRCFSCLRDISVVSVVPETAATTVEDTINQVSVTTWQNVSQAPVNLLRTSPAVMVPH